MLRVAKVSGKEHLHLPNSHPQIVPGLEQEGRRRNRVVMWGPTAECWSLYWSFTHVMTVNALSPPRVSSDDLVLPQGLEP